MSENMTSRFTPILLFLILYPIKGLSDQSISAKANTTLPATSLISCDKVVGKKLAVSTACSTKLKAEEPENLAGLMMSADEEYTVTVPSVQTWHDASRLSTPPCGESGSSIMNLVSVLKRSKKSLWFSLIAEIKGENKPYDLCLSENLMATENGKLILYANDAKGFYKNNSGEILVEIYRNK
ncbi:hypothetical protein [Methylobacter sp.]|uniref:hypothetical protein n=1 Tax=Methylobacter sp. TaxID=2051955 RepID=UPI002FDC801C